MITTFSLLHCLSCKLLVLDGLAVLLLGAAKQGIQGFTVTGSSFAQSGIRLLLRSLPFQTILYISPTFKGNILSLACLLIILRQICPKPLRKKKTRQFEFRKC